MTTHEPVSGPIAFWIDGQYRGNVQEIHSDTWLARCGRAFQSAGSPSLAIAGAIEGAKQIAAVTVS